MLARATRIHSETSALAADVAAFDDGGHWRGTGARSCAEWITRHLGFSRHDAEALLLAGHGVRELPEVAEAFAAGEISLDKARMLAPVVLPEDDGKWAQIARESMPGQLARKCREERRSRLITDAEHERVQRAERSLRMWFDEHSMFHLSGRFPRVDGALLEMAIKKATERWNPTIPPELDPADDGFFARQADAFVALCVAGILGEPGVHAKPVPVQLVVHADLGVLTGETPDGRGHIEDGPALSWAALQWLGCDASVKTILEREGVEIGATRDRHRVSAAMRRTVQSRDRTCRFPKCSTPATRCQIHHIDWRSATNPSEPWNLIAACEADHGAHHRGELEILRTPEGDLRFLGSDGRLLGMATGGHWKVPKRRAGP
jgi:hypothetical protein